MPKRTPRPCRVPSCPKLTTHRRGYCDDHMHLALGWVKRESASKRAGRRGSTRLWLHIREQVKQRAKGLCEACKKKGLMVPGSECDHILNNGNDSLSNLQWLCKPCHKAKISQESCTAQASSRPLLDELRQDEFKFL